MNSKTSLRVNKVLDTKLAQEAQQEIRIKLSWLHKHFQFFSTSTFLNSEFAKLG